MITEDQMSEAALGRQRLLEGCCDRVSHIAHRALTVLGLSNDEFIMVCIAVDSRWRSIVDELMPNEDWQVVRDRGETPVAYGSVIKETIYGRIVSALPPIRIYLDDAPNRGHVLVVILDDTGGTVCEIPATEQIAN